MPWSIVKVGDMWQLKNDDTRAMKGPKYPTKPEARRYQKALYANVPEARDINRWKPTGK